MTQQLALLIAVSFFAFGCASLAPQEASPPEDQSVLIPSKRIPTIPETVERSIDYLGLHRALGMERTKEDLGYAEKSFDTCSVGYGYSSSNNCRREVFIAIHFQILCRDTDGTISNAVAREDMKPLSGRSLKWTLKGARGVLRLDGEGFGQIKTAVSNSQRLERLKIAVDNDFVYLRAGEVKRLVTPKNWCN
jgi:hypothetical protein